MTFWPTKKKDVVGLKCLVVVYKHYIGLQQWWCRDLSFGFATKAKACKGASQK
jgi:hypothetical protein